MQITKGKFRAWLSNYHPRTKVARYYEETGMDYNPIQKFFMSNGGTYTYNTLPRWARQFVNMRYDDSMSAGRALSILEETSGRAAVG